jgi:glycosyltransferase involved in cell wall biosynthesis
LKSKLSYSKKIISFSKNFGHQSALLAGLHKSKGEMVVTMDGDLQHPPDLIVKMVKLCKQGYEIVLTQKIDKNVTSGFKRFSSTFFYKLINLFSSTKIVDSASDFRLIKRNALNELLNLPEKRIFLRGLVNWIGFEKIIIPFEVKNRAAGESKYTLKKMLLLAITGLTSFSTAPLYLAGIIGLIMSILSAIYAIYVIIEFSLDKTVSGWASLLLVVLIIGSGIFIFLGVIGVYIAAIYDEIKSRPNYIIKEYHNE